MDTIKQNFKTARESARYDLKIPNGERTWDIYDSPLGGTEKLYSEAFKDVVPTDESGKSRTLQQYIREYYSKKKGSLVMVDVGGPGSKLAQGINMEGAEKWLKRSLGVVLKDKRNAQERRVDKNSGHSILQADAFTKNGFLYERFGNPYKLLGTDAVKQWLGDDKIDILFEKLHGGWDQIEFDTKFLYLVLNNWYKMMSKNSTMFIQTPIVYPSEVQELFLWVNSINEIWSKKLSVRGEKDNKYQRFYISIQKLDGAPEELPKL